MQIDDIDSEIDELESELDALEEEVTEEPTGESDDVADEPESVEEPAPVETAAEKGHQVPVDLYTDTRKQKDEAERQLAETQAQLDAANARLNEASVEQSVEAAGIKPYSEEEISDLEDEFGDAVAQKMVDDRNATVQLAKQVNQLNTKLESADTERELVQSMAETPELMKWYRGMQAGDKEMDKRISMAAQLEPFAQTLYPDSASERNKYIERQVSEALGLELPKQGKTAARRMTVEDPAIGNMAGGAQVGAGSKDELMQRVLSSENPSEADLDAAFEASMM